MCVGLTGIKGRICCLITFFSLINKTKFKILKIRENKLTSKTKKKKVPRKTAGEMALLDDNKQTWTYQPTL